MKFANVVAGAALFASTVAAADLDPIVIKGSKFFYENKGEQFYIRGVAYQEEATGSKPDDYKDPLADPESCKRDVPMLEKLGANTIRVYAVDPESDHKECMDLLSKAGIYVIADLSSPGESINRKDAKWDNDLYKRYTAVVDELSQYKNVIGFFAGNEVSNSKQTTDASAYVKAAVRDTKAYIKSKNYRPMGVGYATSDDSDIRNDMADYFNCEDQDESIDFWGYNIYSWCGDSSFKESGFDVRTKEFKDYNVPVFFAEYGCNAVKPRKFTEVEALYGPQMSDVWSGGIVYMYFQEDNDYGLVEVKGGEAKPREDYSYLSKQLAKATPSGTKMDSYKPTNTALQKCPEVNNKWLATASPLPPSPNEDLCSCMEDSLSCALKDDVDDKKLDKVFGTVCGYEGVCDGISGNATKGEYGAYSVCETKQQLSFAMNQYYEQQKSQGNGAKACDFDGAAETKSAKSPSGTCGTLLKEAGSKGTGTVKSGSSGSSDSEGSSASASGSEGAAFVVAPGSVNVGFVHVGAYVVTAMVAGMGMILL